MARNRITKMWRIWITMTFGGALGGALLYVLISPQKFSMRLFSTEMFLSALTGFLVGFGYYIFVKGFTRLLTHKLITKSESLLKKRVTVLPSVFKSSEIDEMEETTQTILSNLKEYRENLLQTAAESEKVKKTFGYYISPAIVDKIIAAEGTITTSGENMDIVILFVDLHGFQEFVSQIGNKQAFQFINEYFQAMGEIIEKKEGFIDKYVDQEIVVLFGAPFKHLDDELRACESALKMREKFSSQMNTWKEQYPGSDKLEFKIGINKGNVVVGNIGSEHKLNYTAIGDNMNFAARLCSNAAPGEILISDSVHKIIKRRTGELRITPKKPISVKGKQGKFNTYAL